MVTTMAATPVSPVRIRELTPDDLPEVMRIDAFHTGVPKPEYWQRLFREGLASGEGAARIGLAAVASGGLAGFLVGEVRAFEFGSEPCGWIVVMGVDPSYLRHGVASTLLQTACRRFEAAGVKTVRTMVRRNDVPVLTFFRTNGFAGGPYVQMESPVDAVS